MKANFSALALRLHYGGFMGDGFRDRIWRYLDDPEFERYEGLRNALYRLLVASEIPRGAVPSSIDAKGCLDLAAAAVRGNNAAVIARACDLVDDLVTRLAGLGAPAGSDASACN